MYMMYILLMVLAAFGGIYTSGAPVDDERIDRMRAEAFSRNFVQHHGAALKFARANGGARIDVADLSAPSGQPPGESWHLYRTTDLRTASSGPLIPLRSYRDASSGFVVTYWPANDFAARPQALPESVLLELAVDAGSRRGVGVAERVPGGTRVTSPLRDGESSTIPFQRPQMTDGSLVIFTQID